METLEIGKYLFASCSAEDYGKIVGAGNDDNGVPTIDIEVFHADDLISFEGDTNLTTLHCGHPIVLRHVQYRLKEINGETCIECDTPGNNCHRCTKLFWIYDLPNAGI